jgi:acetyl esterase/lipase
MARTGRRIWVRMAPAAVVSMVAAGLAGGLAPASAAGATASYTSYSNIEYVAGGTSEQNLDLYVPTGSDRARPLIIFVHGGGWSGGGKNELDQTNKQAFLDAGFAIASVNYTLSGTAKFPQQIYDLKAAIRYLRANAREYGLDGSIGLWGHSAGGQLVALAGTSCGVRPLEGNEGNRQASSCVQAVVDGYGPTDFLQMDTHLTVPGAGLHDPASSAESQYLGCTSGLLACPVSTVEAANPITYITASSRQGDRGDRDNRLPAFLIAHGDADTAVPIWESQILYTALSHACDDVSFYTLHGIGHVFFLNFVNALNPPYPSSTLVKSDHCSPTRTTESTTLTWQTLVGFFHTHLR